ncbi:MAG: hypothetical protein LBV34_26245 [Nocardiopsaceae bacterium]|nr:hypothetical protein [Nocardiopsaceae bacterium]
MTEPSLPELEQQRAELHAQLAAIGDLRPGSINATYRRCGKPNCACAQPGHRGHGPRWLLTRSADGKTRTRQLGAAELAKVREELAHYKVFTDLSQQIVQVSEAICEARPVPADTPARGGPGSEKGGSGPGSPPRRRLR